MTTTKEHAELLTAVESYTHALYQQNLIDRQQLIADIQAFLAPYSPIPAQYSAAYLEFEEMATIVGYGQQTLGRGMNKFMDYVWDTTEKSLVIPSPLSNQVHITRQTHAYTNDFRIVSHPQQKWVLQYQPYKGGHWRNQTQSKMGYEAAYTLLIIRAEANDNRALPEITLQYPNIVVGNGGIDINYNTHMTYNRDTCLLRIGAGYHSKDQTVARMADVEEKVSEMLDAHYRKQLERPTQA